MSPMVDAPIREGALRIIRALTERGHRALLAGGCVRDMRLGRAPKDWDVATDAGPEDVVRLFDRVLPIGVEFGIVTVVLEDGHYEVARFRRDGPYQDGRHPDHTELAAPEEDARRRDFTINGMFYDPLEERLIDYVGGEGDLQRQLVRAIGNPRQRFEEDFLRMLRAVRFAARLGFALEPATAAAIAESSGKISRVSAERIRDELTLILTEGAPAFGMGLLMQLGLMQAVLPEVAATQGVPQPPEYHPEGDVWSHVQLMLDKLDAPSATLAWGVLLHDIGKPPTFIRADRIRFNGHDARGAEMAAAIGQRLRLPKVEGENIRELTAQHMRFGNVKEMRASKLKRFLRQPIFPELLELHRVDCLASHGKLDLYEFCREKSAEAGEEGLRPPRLVTGHDLIGMGLEPGPRLGEILQWVEDEQLEGRLADRKTALAAVELKYLAPKQE